MRTPANVAGHPIHPMLVTIPIGLWIFSLVTDFVSLRSADPETWATVSYYALIGGIIGALCAAVPGLIDFMQVRKTDVRPTAVAHMSINLTVVAIYIVNAWLRHSADTVGGLPLLLSVVAIAMLVVSGWLGGKMVYMAGIGVDDQAEHAKPQRPQERHT